MTDDGTDGGIGAPLRLAPTLDIKAAPALVEGLLARRGGPLSIDASAVERLGAQCAQALVSAARTWAADGAPFELRDPSPEMLEQLRVLGLENLGSSLATPGVGDLSQ